MRRLLVFGFSVFLLAPSAAFAASLSINPSSGLYTVGSQIFVSVSVTSAVSMNAASGVISFPSDVLSVDYVTKGSVLNFWVTEPTFSNAAGTVSFEGVSLSGFQGSNGNIATVVFHVKKAGSAAIAFQSGQILANDGQGTDITTGKNGATYTLAAPTKAAPAPKPEPAPEPAPSPEPTPEPVVTVQSGPTIHIGVINGSEAILGSSSYPDADVVLAFVSSGGSKVYITGKSDENGNFSLVVPTVLRNGPYAVTATMALGNGKQSDPSDPLTVQIGGTFLAYVDWQAATYGSVLLSIILLLAVLYFMWMRYFRPSQAKTAVHREVSEAKDVLHRSMNLLREDVAGHIKRSEKEKGGHERSDMQSLKKDLDDAEDVIEKEIRDIGSVPLDEGR